MGDFTKYRDCDNGSAFAAGADVVDSSSSRVLGDGFGGGAESNVWVMMYVVVGGDDDPKGQGKGILQHDTAWRARARFAWKSGAGPISLSF
jgi:hypothetical protein